MNFNDIRSRMNRKSVALVLTFGLVLTGSGLASLASLSDTLQDTVTFNTLSVDLKDGTAESSAISFSGIDPTVGGTYTQTIQLHNSGSASATVSVATAVTTGAGSDLDDAIRAAAYADAVRLGNATPWAHIDGLGADIGTFTLTANQTKVITITFNVAPYPAVTSTLVAQITFTAVHP